jgi:hypothetical protein
MGVTRRKGSVQLPYRCRQNRSKAKPQQIGRQKQSRKSVDSPEKNRCCHDCQQKDKHLGKRKANLLITEKQHRPHHIQCKLNHKEHQGDAFRARIANAPYAPSGYCHQKI